MDMTKRAETFDGLLMRVKQIAKEVAAPNAVDIDAITRGPLL